MILHAVRLYMPDKSRCCNVATKECSPEIFRQVYRVYRNNMIQGVSGDSTRIVLIQPYDRITNLRSMALEV